MSHVNSHAPEMTLDKAELKALYTVNPWRHAAAMVFNWVIIFATILICTYYFSPFIYVASVLIIGARMHALAILMHDATHFRFLKDRNLSDLITNLTLMYWIFSSIEKYRQNHLRHHQHLNTEEDPDWVAKLGKKEFTFPKTKQEFILTILSYFTLVQGIRDAIWFLKRFSPPAKTEKKRSPDTPVKLAFYLTLAIVLSVFGLWGHFLLYWIVPYLSTFFMYQYIRSVSEHFGDLEYDHEINSSRTLKANFIERFFLAPHHVGYHIEHHLYPGVPFYHLPALHKLLMKSPEYREKAHVTNGVFTGLMHELG